MPSPSELRATIESYVEMMCRSDIEGIMALYADDATAEDPVGGDVQHGSEAIKNFYSMTAPLLQVELSRPHLRGRQRVRLSPARPADYGRGYQLPGRYRRADLQRRR